MLKNKKGKLQVLMTEVHKLVKSEVPTARHKTLTSFSRKRLRYRNFQVIANENKNIVRYESETTCYRTPHFWTNAQKLGIFYEYG